MANKTRLQCLLFALGYTGGTIHQIANETGVPVDQLLMGCASTVNIGSDYYNGASAVMTCSLEFNKKVNFPKACGKADFWLGVISGVQTMEKLGTKELPRDLR